MKLFKLNQIIFCLLLVFSILISSCGGGGGGGGSGNIATESGGGAGNGGNNGVSGSGDGIPVSTGTSADGVNIVAISPIYIPYRKSVYTSILVLNEPESTPYSINFVVANQPNSVPPTITMQPNCSKINSANESCSIIINAESATPNSYAINTILKNNQTGSIQPFNAFSAIVESDSNTTITQQEGLAVILESSTISASQTINAFIIFQGGSSDKTVTITSNDPNVATASPTTCNLNSTNYYICSVQITGQNPGKTTIKASLPDGTTALSTTLLVNTSQKLNNNGTLKLSIYNSTINQGGSSSALVTLNNSNGVSGLNVNLSSTDMNLNLDGLTISPSNCTLSDAPNNYCIVNIAASATAATGIQLIQASAIGYTTIQSELTVNSNVGLIIPGTINLSVSPSTLQQGENAIATLTLNGSQNVPSTEIYLASSDSSISLSQPTCSLSSTQSQCSFAVDTALDSTVGDAVITASDANSVYNSQATITVNPQGNTPQAGYLSISSESTITRGGTVTATITLVNSIGITTPLQNLTVTTSDNTYLTLDSYNCSLTSSNNQCSVTLQSPSLPALSSSYNEQITVTATDYLATTNLTIMPYNDGVTVIPGSLVLLQPFQNILTPGGSTIASISLNDSQNVSYDPVTISTGNSSEIYVTNPNCILYTGGTCQFTVAAIGTALSSPKTAMVTASDDYGNTLNIPITINPATNGNTTVAGNLSVSISPSTILQNGSATATISLNNSSGITASNPVVVNISSSTPLVNLNKSTCSLTSLQGNTCTIQLTPSQSQPLKGAIYPIITAIATGYFPNPESAFAVNPISVSSPGILSLGLAKSSLMQGQSTTATLTLKGSTSDISGVNVQISPQNTNLIKTSKTNCTLSYGSPTCSFNVTAKSSPIINSNSIVSIIASAESYNSTESSITITPNSSTYPGNLTMSVSPSNNIAPESTVIATVYLNNSGANSTGYNVSVGTPPGNTIQTFTVSPTQCPISHKNPTCQFTLIGTDTSSTWPQYVSYISTLIYAYPTGSVINQSASPNNPDPSLYINAFPGYATPGFITITPDSSTIMKANTTQQFTIRLNDYHGYINPVQVNIGASPDLTINQSGYCLIGSYSPTCTFTATVSSNPTGGTESIYANGGYSASTSIYVVPSNNDNTIDWMQLTNGTSSESKPGNAVAAWGDPTHSNIFITESISYPKLWFWDGANWHNLYPTSNNFIVYGNPTESSIVLRDNGTKYLYVSEVATNNNYGNWTRINSTSVGGTAILESTVYGAPTYSSIVFQDTTNGLWTYDGTNLGVATKQSTGGQNPSNVSTVYGSPTPTNIVMKDTSNALWTYDGQSWTKQSNGGQKPSNVSTVYGLATTTNIVMKDTANSLWTYDGTTWTKQTGGNAQPPNVSTVFSYPSATGFIIISDTNNTLWNYNLGGWVHWNGFGQPSSVANVYGVATANSIVMTDNNKMPWFYNGGTWNQSANTVYNIYGSPTVHFTLMLEYNYSLYAFYNGTYATLSNQTGAPQSVNTVYGFPTENSIVMTDNSANLWTYDGTNWLQKSGGSQPQPNFVSNVFGTPEYDSIIATDTNNNLWVYRIK